MCAGRYGSRGDVEPCAVVGRELLRRGHDVRMAVPPNMFAFVESVGLNADGLWTRLPCAAEHGGGIFRHQMNTPIPRCPRSWNVSPRSGWTRARRSHRSTEGADVLVTGMNEQRLAANIAEHQDIPLVALHFFPSRLQPSGMLNSQLTKLSEEPLRRALGLPEAPEPTAALLEIQAYDERCLAWAACAMGRAGQAVRRRAHIGIADRCRR